jgi:hypothetical protein
MTYQSFDGHGVDVAVNRADDLDKRALAYIADRSGCRVLDLGSGAGGQSVRMATAGANVLAVDQYDFTDVFTGLRTEHNLTTDQLDFSVGDLVGLSTQLADAQFAITTLQRTLHYLPYEQACSLLTYLRTITTDKLYISVTGTGSLIGDSYPCKTEDLSKRFCELTELGKEMFQIYQSVCLYSQDEFRALLSDSGWTVDDIWVSAFGNIKAVCSNL